jgi:site-specific recombinase XerD
MKQQKATAVGNLGQLKSELERRLIVMRYSNVTTSHYMRIFGWVEEYLTGYGETNYSPEWGQRFITEYLLSSHPETMFKSARTVVRRLDEILENRMFTPCFREPASECPLHFTDCLEGYLDALAKRGLRDSTIRSRRTYAGKLLGRIPATVLLPENITAADLHTAFANHVWPTVGYVAARDFLAFLYKNGLIKFDLSVCVPNPRRQRSLPSVYTENEVARLLASIDRSTVLGKRDYAILMLASHMGLRSSDIVNLSLTDIDYASGSIGIVQVKTAAPVTLVMNADVEEAITDYIRHGRPASSSDKIFLGSQAPFMPLSAASGHAIAHRHFSRAGIAAQGRRRGTQALRASYATALVSKGIPYMVVQEALGHDDPESAKYYVRIDVKRLRMCALDVPKPSGAFAVMLGDLEGVL